MLRSSPVPSPSDEGDTVKARSRSVLLGAVDLYVQAPTHDRAEVRAFGDLVDGLLADAGDAERRYVSVLLAKRADVPLELARRLAMDDADVAAPMIVGSPVLTSSDLVQILRCGPEHVRLVAKRLELGSEIASVLIDSNFARTPNRRDAAPAIEPARVEEAAPTRAEAPVRAETPMTAPAEVSRPAAAEPVPPAAQAPRPAPIAIPVEAAEPVAAHPAPLALGVPLPIAPVSLPANDAATAQREVIAMPVPEAAPADALDTAPAIPHFRVPLRPETQPARETVARDTGAREAGVREPVSARRAADLGFLDLDTPARWRAIQLAAAEAAVAGPARGRRDFDPIELGDRLFAAAVRRDLLALASALGEVLDLEATTAIRVVGDPSGEPLALALAASDVDERRATSILVLSVGAEISLEQMQDLAAIAGRIGRRTAELLVAKWRGTRTGRPSETRRVLDGAERREAPSAMPAERGDTRRGLDDALRRLGGDGR